MGGPLAPGNTVLNIDFSCISCNNCLDLCINDDSNNWSESGVLLWTDITSAYLEITVGGVLYTVDVTSVFLAATSPNDLSFYFDSTTDYGSGYVYRDGFHSIKYIINSSTYSISYSVTKEFLFSCNVACSIYDEIRKLGSYYGCSKCDKTYMDNLRMKYELLQGMDNSMRCNNYGNASELYTLLNRLTTFINCR